MWMITSKEQIKIPKKVIPVIEAQNNKIEKLDGLEERFNKLENKIEKDIKELKELFYKYPNKDFNVIDFIPSAEVAYEQSGIVASNIVQELQPIFNANYTYFDISWDKEVKKDELV